ncbi:MAG: transposase [Sphaerospermopsis sp. SIO1G2]|nr:transposase [Sphaerospermopsis sp. SIO1G2]
MYYTCRIGVPQWDKIYAYLCEFKGLHTGNERSTRRFVEGVFWLLRSGSQWRMLSSEYGNWNHVYQRFSRWCEKGIFHKMLYYFQLYSNYYVVFLRFFQQLPSLKTMLCDSRCFK